MAEPIQDWTPEGFGPRLVDCKRIRMMQDTFQDEMRMQPQDEGADALRIKQRTPPGRRWTSDKKSDRIGMAKEDNREG